MLSSIQLRRGFRITAILTSLALVSACSDDDPIEPGEEPEVQSVRLTSGATTAFPVTINKTNGQPSGNLRVGAGTTPITAAWLRADNTNETLISDAEYELRIVPTNAANLTWTAAGAFTGTLTTTGLTSGQTTTASVALRHKIEQHDDFGPYTITIQVQ